MHYDTETMRKQAAALPGRQLTIDKVDYERLLQAIERGQGAENDLATMRRVLIGAGTTAAAA
jgi:hypothetical protein